MTLTAIFRLNEPLPKYQGREVLVRNLIDHITTGGFSVGSRFLSDHDVVSLTGRSRSAVRQALSVLQEQGWIDRVGGKGTFVGKKLLEIQPGNRREVTAPSKKESTMLRVAVAMSGVIPARAGSSSNWYFGGVMQGIDEAADRANVSVELLGFRRSRSSAYAKRVAQNPPHAFLCIGPPMDHAPIIELGGRYGIPCVMAGTRNPEFGLPNIFDDSVTAARDAVAHLVELGHRRMGYLQVMSPSGWWAFDRYEGFLNGIREFHLEKDVELGLWLPLHPTEHSADMIRRYIDRFGLTAVVCGSLWTMNHLAELIRRDGLRIPDDLSCIVFDQDPSARHLLGGVEPTTVHLPMREMGMAFIDMVHELVEGKQIPQSTALPCTIVQGDSTAAITRNFSTNHILKGESP